MRCFPVAAPSASSRRSGSSPPHQPRPRPPLLPSRRGHRRRQGSIPAAAGAGARREGGGQPGEEGRHQRVVSVQASKLVKYLTSTGSLQGHAESLSDASVRHFSSASSSQANSTDENGFKGHGMLAPFIAGWQSNDVHPLVIERSEGSYVYDINGNKHLDSLAGLWCTALGGSEPRLVKAATDQLNKLPFYHSFWNRTTKPTLDLADDLLSMFTASKMGKAFFINSGSEANDSQQADGINLLSLLLEPAIIYIVCSLIIGKNGGGVAQEQDFGVVCCPGESRQEE